MAQERRWHTSSATMRSITKGLFHDTISHYTTEKQAGIRLLLDLHFKYLQVDFMNVLVRNSRYNITLQRYADEAHATQ
eukprot:scaffold155079_cov39-Tisochrysis_lutea.AAC.2